MAFKRSLQRYSRTPEVETPYSRAGQVWDARIGSARAQARNWRVMAFGNLLLATGLAAGLLWQSNQSKIVPYVVAVDKLGEPQTVGPATATYQPGDAELAWFLAHFIDDVRGLPLDPVIVRENWLEAYSFVTARGALALNAQARASNPFAEAGERSVAVQVTSVVRVSDQSFQVKWIEKSFDQGNLTDTAHWTAVLTMTIKPPTTTDALRRNPLGLFVDALDWSRELDVPVAGGLASNSPIASQQASGSAAPLASTPSDTQVLNEQRSEP